MEKRHHQKLFWRVSGSARTISTKGSEYHLADKHAVVDIQSGQDGNPPFATMILLLKPSSPHGGSELESTVQQLLLPFKPHVSTIVHPDSGNGITLVFTISPILNREKFTKTAVRLSEHILNRLGIRHGFPELAQFTMVRGKNGAWLDYAEFLLRDDG